MSKKATKAPALKPNQPYLDWKKELTIWEMTNTALNVEKRVQAGILFESLEGAPRRTVLSELKVEEISSEDGVNNIIKTLDRYFIGNATKNAFTNIDELVRFRCKPNVSIENFIIEFQILVNRVKASGTVISDGVLGYVLLCAANLPEDKFNMVKVSCVELTFNEVKAQLEKIGMGKQGDNSKKYVVSPKSDSLDVKVEPCFYGQSSNTQLLSDSSDISS